MKKETKHRSRLISFTILVLSLWLMYLPARTMAGESCTEIAQNWADFWNSHDAGLDAVLAVFTEDGIYEDVPLNRVNRGAEQISAFAQTFFDGVPDLAIELVNASCNGHQGFIEWIFSGTDVGVYRTGKEFSVRGVTVIQIEGKRISRNSDYWDLATVLRQLGLLPPGL